ncbi:MAG: Hsp33 family molecular chaperone HslO [Chitinivibrionia bacterium]|nr:Hsp33 family molecular chaperone HslO [Chitinivibrionia bacterium]MCL1947760.1 Hsp33 family molecular chaperone HslO [Chitinivibrionia bacterium]
MTDTLIKAISKSGTIRAFAAITTNTVNSAYEIQKPATLSGIILGNTLTAALLCGATLKGSGERISLTYKGNGVIGKAMAEATANGKVRGYAANPQSEFCEDVDVKTQINEAIGKNSQLTVCKDLGLKQPYSGTINCVTGDIGSDVAYYFTQSEQIPSAVAVSTIPNNDNSGVEISGGYLVQKIAQNEKINANETTELEKISLATSAFSLNSTLLEKKNPEDLLKNIFSDVEYEVLDSVNLSFECACDKENLLNALNLFDDETKKEIKRTDDKIQIICEFCKKIYYILPQEVR